MDEEVFNLGVRKFLKKVGVQSQREIEQAVRYNIERYRNIASFRCVAGAGYWGRSVD